MKRIEKSLIAMAIALSIVSSPVLPYIQIEASDEIEQPPEMTVVSEEESDSLLDESTEVDTTEKLETFVEETTIDETTSTEDILVDEPITEETSEVVEETEIVLVDEVAEIEETFETEIVIETETSEVTDIEETIVEDVILETEETLVNETEESEVTEITEDEFVITDETISYEYPIEEVEPNVFVATSLDEYLDYLSSMQNVEKLIINTTDDLTVLFAECGVFYEGTYVLGFTESSMYENAVSYCMENGYEFSIDGEMSICADEDEEVSVTNTINPNASVRVAVIDTGSNICNEAYSVISDSVTDINGHGTLMANLILSETNNAYIISIKALGDNGKGDVSDVYAALELARELDVDVILLAISVRDYGQYGAFKSLVEELMNSGITVIASAGNNNSSALVYIPGGIDGVTTVGSIDNLGYKTANSNYGYSVDYYVVSDSTSEAAAIFTGKYISGDISDIATEYKEAISTEAPTDVTEEENEIVPIEESFTTNGYNGTPYIYWVDGNSLATYGFKSGEEFANAVIANCEKMEGAAYSQSVQGKVDCITYVNLAYAATLGQISNLRMENGQVKFDGSVAGGTYQLYSTTGATSCLYWGNMAKHNVGNGGVPYTSLSATLSQYGARKGDIVLFGKFNTLYRAVVTVPGGTVTTQWVSSKNQATLDAATAIQTNHGTTFKIEATEGNEFDWTHAAIYSGEGTDFYEALSAKLPAGLYTISDAPQIDVTDGTAKSYNRIAILSYLEPEDTYDDAFANFKIVKTTTDGMPARGAQFEIYTEKGSLYTSFKDVTNNGSYEPIKALAIGSWNPLSPTQVITKYTYKETKAATEYYDGSKWVSGTFLLDANTYSLYVMYDPVTDILHYTVCIEKPGVATQYIINDAQIKGYMANGGVNNKNALPGITHTNLLTGSVSVKKVTPDGTELTGASFTVYSDSGCTKSVGSLAYNATSKKYVYSGLVSGTYYLKETAAPTGYIKDPNAYRFTISEDKLNVTVSNTSWNVIADAKRENEFVNPQYGSVSVKKVDKNGTALTGATFTVYSDSACTKSVGTLSYDSANKIYKLGNLNVATTYYLKETKAPTGYMLDPNVYSFTPTAKNNNVTISNVNWTAIADVKRANEFVDPQFGSVTVKKVTPNGTELTGATFTVYSDAACTKKVGTLVYDTTAKIYKLGGLNVATTYYLKETVAPKNYYIDPNVYSFKPTAKAPEQKITNVTWDKVSGYNKSDSFVDPEILGSVTVNKVDVNGATVTGATFTVYSDAVCTKSVGTMKYNATKKVYELGELSLGTYYVKETAAPSGFIKDPNVYSFTLTTANLNVTVSNTSWTAISGATQAGKFVEPEFGSVTVKKVDKNGTVLTGAEFKVYSDVTCSKTIGTLTYDTATQEYKLGNLNIGTYYLKETVAPKNYYLDPNVYSFTITAKDNNKQISNISWEKVSGFNRTGEFVDLEILGDVSLKKVDVNGTAVAGATFIVYSDSMCTKVVDTLAYNESLEVYELKELSLGTYYLKETVAPLGFIADPNVYSFELTAANLNVVISNETWATLGEAAQSGMFVEPEFGSVKLNKIDENGNKLSGAEFMVYGDEECTVEVGKLTESDGTYTLGNLYMGTYFLKETVAPMNHYLDPNTYVFEITAKDNNVVISNTTWEKVAEYDRTDDFINPEILGLVSLEKVDVRGNVVSGAVFTVYEDAECTQVVGDLSYNDETSKYELNSLSVGTYYLRETVAPSGFIADPNVYEFNITVENLNAVVSNESWSVISGAIVEGKFVEPEFGSVSLKKVDENGNPLSGAKFMVYSDNECTNEVGTLAEIDGVYTLGNLYMGKYYLKETKAPVNYYPDPNVYDFEITATDNSKMISNITWEPVAKFGMVGEFVNLPKLGTVTVYKRSEDGLVLTDATFVVYRDEALTDVVGELVNSNGIYTLEGLTVGTYFLVEKVPPTGYELDSNSYRFEITETQLDVIVVNVNWEAHEGLAPDSFVNYNPVVKTVLTSDSTMGHTAPAGTKVTLTDTVSYDGLIPGKTYVMSGTLYFVDKNGKALLDEDGNKIPVRDSEGNVIVSNVEFVPENTTGIVAVEFVIDSTLLMGETIYCEENCYRDERLVGFHHEVVPDQTAFVPEVFTQFYDRNLGDEYDCTSYGSVTLVDKVTVANISAGTYEVTGTIHLKSNGEALKDQNGKVISSTTVFEVSEDELTNGCCTKNVEVVFENVDVTKLEGESLVCFENLTSLGVTLVTHEDLEDGEQTVRVPEIGTTLVEPESKTSVVYISEECVLEDVIRFEGLTPGKEYEATGTLYDVQTGEAILNSDGTPVVSEITKFVPQTADGEVKVTFRFNSSLIVGEIKTIVAFEDVYDVNSGRLVATHADLNDTNQQVKVPSVTTTATVNGSKVFLPGENASLKDVIEYTGLEAGHEYRVETSVMRKDGTEFQVDGVSVNKTSTFTPADSDGFYSVEFSFNAKSLLNEQQLVVYQMIYDGETNSLVATHCDKNDEGQTVTARFIVTTGEDGNLAAAHTMMGVASAVSAAGLIAVMNKRRKDESEKDKEDS